MRRGVHEKAGKTAIHHAHRHREAGVRSTATPAARLHHLALAMGWAERAVAEAWYAKPRDHEGPTEMQSEASRIADECTRSWEVALRSIAGHP